jgi:hypothetical protein
MGQDLRGPRPVAGGFWDLGRSRGQAPRRGCFDGEVAGGGAISGRMRGQAPHRGWIASFNRNSTDGLVTSPRAGGLVSSPRTDGLVSSPRTDSLVSSPRAGGLAPPDGHGLTRLPRQTDMVSHARPARRTWSHTLAPPDGSDLDRHSLIPKSTRPGELASPGGRGGAGGRGRAKTRTWR